MKAGLPVHSLKATRNKFTDENEDKRFAQLRQTDDFSVSSSHTKQEVVKFRTSSTKF